MDLVTIIMNGIALLLGLSMGIAAFKYQMRFNKKKSAWMWLIGLVAFFLIFLNGIALYGKKDYENDTKEAYGRLENEYKEQGDKDQDSFKNLTLTIDTSSSSKNTSHRVFVKNFNKHKTFNGTVQLQFLNYSGKVKLEHQSEKLNLKSGEEFEYLISDGVSLYTTYRWEWNGDLE